MRSVPIKPRRNRPKMRDYGTELDWLRFVRRHWEELLPEATREIQLRWMQLDYEKETKKICPERAGEIEETVRAFCSPSE